MWGTGPSDVRLGSEERRAVQLVNCEAQVPKDFNGIPFLPACDQSKIGVLRVIEHHHGDREGFLTAATKRSRHEKTFDKVRSLDDSLR